MQFWQTKAKSSCSRGFTLIEMLVIAPIAIIIIAGFIGLMIRMTGEVLSSQQRSAQVYNSQDALNRIEQDVNHAGMFASTVSASSLTSPQGSGDNGSAWSTSPGGSTLVLQEYATTENPLSTDTSIDLVYTASPNSCSNYPDYTYNTPYFVYVIYFLRTPAGSSTSTLWRRTILPPASPSPCGTPWQRNTCAPGATMNGSPCKSSDEEILDNVTSAVFDYYLNPGDASSTNDIGSANTLNATLTTSESVASYPYTYTSSLRATRLNSAQ